MYRMVTRRDSEEDSYVLFSRWSDVDVVLCDEVRVYWNVFIVFVFDVFDEMFECIVVEMCDGG